MFMQKRPGLFGNAMPQQPQGLLGQLNAGQNNMLPQTQQRPALDVSSMAGMRPQLEAMTQPKHEGVNWLGVLADTFSGLAGQPGQFAARMDREREQQRQSQAQQAEHERARGEWLFQQQWKKDNEPAPRNDTVDDFNFYKGMGPEDRAIYDQQHPIVIQSANGPMLVPRSSMGGMNAPVGGGLDSQPAVEDGHSYTPGPGGRGNKANWRAVGGGVGNGPGGFPTITGSRLDNITMQSESGGNPNAVSPKGARGLMQVMPGTARDPGFGIKPSDGSQSDDARVGREYRATMQSRYGNNLPKMWAAYNWGPGNLDRALATYGDNWLDHAPAETRNYVNNNMRQVRGR